MYFVYVSMLVFMSAYYTYVSILLCIFSCLVVYIVDVGFCPSVLQYVSLFRYSIEALAVNEVDGLYFI